MPAQKIRAAFTEPMLLLPARTLPEGASWAYELKLEILLAAVPVGTLMPAAMR